MHQQSTESLIPTSYIISSTTVGSQSMSVPLQKKNLHHFIFYYMVGFAISIPRNWIRGRGGPEVEGRGSRREGRRFEAAEV